MKIKTFYITTVLSGLVIAFSIFYSYGRGWFKEEALLYFSIGLLTFIGIFYGILWSQGFEEANKIKAALKK